MLKTLVDYIEAAMRRQGYKSYSQLDRAMGNAGSSTTLWKKRGVLPKPAKMVMLAELAGQDPKIALAQLDKWNAEMQGETRLASLYGSILNTVKAASKAAAVVLVGLALSFATPTPAHAGVDGAQ